MPSRSAVLSLLAFLFAAPAFAQDMPRQLTAELIATEHENCKTSTGYGMAFTRFVDIDGDGHKDVVLDYAQAVCGGDPAPYCNDAGCLLKAYRAEKGSYRRVFEGRVKAWSIGEASGRTVLLVDGHPLP